MNAVIETAAIAPAHYPPRRAVTAWLFFDWAAQPFFTLITTFVFAPFLSATFLPSPSGRGDLLRSRDVFLPGDAERDVLGAGMPAGSTSCGSHRLQDGQKAG